MHLMPKPAVPVELPSKSDTAAYGRYLTNAAGCTECHTKMVKGNPAGEPFAGGFEFALPHGVVRSTNLTPHLVTGIGSWTKQIFVDRFKAFAGDTYKPAPVDVTKGEMQTVMPWTMYANMTPEDLGAIYDYLKTLPAVDNSVERWTPANKK
jgi:hypothetical protein